MAEPIPRSPFPRVRHFLLAVFFPGCVLLAAAAFGEEDPFAWRKELQPERAGNFEPMPPFEAEFSFGWSNVAAASAQVRYQPDGNSYHLEARGATEGLARRLWRLDATHETRGRTRQWLPERMTQLEQYARHRIDIENIFEGDLVRRLRYRTPSPDPPKWKDISVDTPLRDLVATMLFVRSQPLNDGDRIGLVAFPGDSPFFVRLEVEGRDTISIAGRDIPAIRLNQIIHRIETKGEDKGRLSAHRRYRSGTIWISDDELRMPLRSEVRLFIGFVFGRVEWIEFEGRDSPLPRPETR